jgi:hypothetical protein
MARREREAGLDMARRGVFRHLGAAVIVLGIGGYGIFTAAGYVKSNFLGFLGGADYQYAANKGVAEALLAKRQLAGYLKEGLEYYPLWRPVSERLPALLDQPPEEVADWHAFGASLEGFTAKDKRNAIQSYLDGLRFERDRGKNDWSDPHETLARGYGDAEDLASVAYYMALASGHPVESLAITQGRDRRGFEHALVLFEEGGEIWILELAEPGAVPLERSGFTPRVYGQLENSIVPTSKASP